MSIYIDSGSDSPEEPDGSPEAPYLSFDEAYAKKIQVALQTEEVIVVFRKANDPYEFSMQFQAQITDNNPYSINFQSNITDTLVDKESCEQYPTLHLKVPASSSIEKIGNESGLEATRPAFLFQSKYLTVTFQHLNIMARIENEDQPFPGLTSIEASESAEVHYQSVCLNYNNLEILNKTKTSTFAFSSGGTVKVDLQNVYINAAIHIKESSDELTTFKDNAPESDVGDPQILSLFKISSTFKQQTTEKFSEFTVDNLIYSQSIQCEDCQESPNKLEIAAITAVNIPHLTLSKVVANEMESALNNYLFYFPSTQNFIDSKTSDDINSKATLSDPLIPNFSFTDVSIAGASRTTFFQMVSGIFMKIKLEKIQVSNVQIDGKPFINIKATDSDPEFSVEFEEITFTEANIKNTALLNFDISVPKEINSHINIKGFRLEHGEISNEDNPKAPPFVRSNYPMHFEEGEFSNNQWNTVIIFQSTDVPLNIFKFTGTSFTDEKYTTSVLFSQLHKVPLDEDINSPSEIKECKFKNLEFGDASSFLLNQGLLLIFNQNTLEDVTINDGQFIGSGNPPLPNLPYEVYEINHLEIKKDVHEPPEDCTKNCYYLEISGNTITRLNFHTEKNYPLFPIVRPPRLEKSYAVLTDNTFEDINTKYPFVYARNIDSMTFSQNKGKGVKTPSSILNITGNTSTFNIKENSFSEVEALDFITYINLDKNLIPSLSIEGNTLESSTYTRTFITVQTPSYSSLEINSNKITKSNLVCPSTISKCIGIGIYSNAQEESTFKSQGNEFELTSLSIEEDREGFYPNFDNSLLDIQITCSETIELSNLVFTECEMKAVFSSLLTVGGDEIEIDSLKLSKNHLENMNFFGAVHIIGNSFSLSDVEITENKFESDQDRHGFLTSALKIENPVAGDDAIKVKLSGVKIKDNDLSQLESLIKITLPNLDLSIENGDFAKSSGKYFYINSQNFIIQMDQIKYESSPDSTILYIGQGTGKLDISDYKDTAGEGNNSPAFSLENGNKIKMTMTDSVVSNPRLVFIRLADSQLSFNKVTLDKIQEKSKVPSSVITVFGKKIEVDLQSIILINNNAPSSSVFKVGANASDITVTAKGILAKTSLFSSFFDLTQNAKVNIQVSGSAFDQNTFTLTNYGDVGFNNDDNEANANNVFALSDSVLTAHLGSILRTSTANSGDYTFKNIVVSGTTHNDAPSKRVLFSVLPSFTKNPSTPKIQLTDSTLMGVTDVKVPAIMNCIQTAMTIDSTNFINNTFLSTVANPSVFNLALNSSTVSVTNSNFFLNTATYTSGCISLINSDYNIEGCNFDSNLGNTGGAVYTANSIPNKNKTIPEVNTFSHNEAITYGDDVSGDVSRIKVDYLDECVDYNATLFSKYLNDKFIYLQSNLYNIANFSLFSWNCKILIFSFLDYYGNSIQIDPKDTTIMSEGITPIYKCNAINCNLTVTSLQTKSSADSAKLNFNISLSPNSPTITTITFKFLPRACMQGEFISEKDKVCQICPPHTYSFGNTSQCLLCPVAASEGLCLGGNVFYTQPNSWREPGSPHFYKCPDESFGRCQGGAEQEDQCAAGYAGALCLSCDIEHQYGPSLVSSKCSKCNPSTGVEVIFAMLLFTAGFIFEIVYIIVINASNKASSAVDNIRNESFNGEQYYLGMDLGFAVTQIQLLYVVLKYLIFLFPSYSFMFQMIAGPIGLIANPSSFGTTALECVLADSGVDAFTLFKFKIFIESFLPIAKIVVIVGFILIMKAMEKITKIKSLIIVSIFSIVLLEQTPLFLIYIQSLTCYLGDISPPGYLKSDLRVSCGHPGYDNLKAYFIMPSAVFWGGMILIALCVGVALIKKKGPSSQAKRQFGNFINSYKEKTIFWGIAVVLLKLLLVISMHFIIDPAEATVPSMLILLAYYQSSIYLAPYNSRELRRLDQMSCLAFITLIMVSIFSYNTSGRISRIASFLVVFLLCAAILVYTLYQFIKRLAKYIKAMNMEKRANPRASGLLSFGGSFEGQGEAHP